MSWFKRKSDTSQTEQAVRNETAAIEIITHKNATKDLVNEAKEANDKLQELLVKNGFTVKIYIAAGGKTKTNTTKKVIT